MDLKFASHGLWSEKQNVLQHMHKKNFGFSPINVKITRKQGLGTCLFSLVFVFEIISTFIGQNPKFVFMHVLNKGVLLL